MTKRLRLLVLAGLWPLLVAAGPQPMPTRLPLPGIAPLVEIAKVPLDKPPITLPETSPPAPPTTVPPLPRVAVASAAVGLGPKQTIVPPQPATGVCLLTVTARQHLECGRAKFQRSDFEEAQRELEKAVRSAGQNPDILNEARYWQAEALYRLQRTVDAQRLFLQVWRDVPREDIGVYAVYSTGYTWFQQNDYEHAREAFELTQSRVKTGPLSFLSQHWRALSLYYLGKYAEARQGWEALQKMNPPPALARETPFWLGESLAKMGDAVGAEAQLKQFADRGAHPLLPTATLRLGWAHYNAGRVPAARAEFERAQSMTLSPDERNWLQFGLGLALSATGDFPAAEAAFRSLEQRAPQLATAGFLDLAEKLRVAKRNAEAHALDQFLLGRQNLTPAERAWILFNEGEVFRKEVKDGALLLDDARTHYDLARKVDATTHVGWQAGLRTAQMNFELREFAQATKEAEALLSQVTPIELRAAALLLAGEAAYYARDYEASANWFRKFLSESPSNPQVKDAVLSLGWAELRRGKEAAARQIFTDFARDFASDTAAPDALMLSAELAESAGDIAAAQQQYDRMRVGYSGHPRHSLALLDGAILMMRTDRVSNAIATLQDFLKAAPDSPQAPRARTALAVARLATGAPAQAEQEITAALQGSDDPVTHLAAGVAAIELSKWDAAEKQLALARDSGSPAVVERAEAALTVMAFRRGQKDQFRQLANGIVAAGRPTAPLLYALADAETQDKSWDAALQTTKRLVTTFPDDVSADDSLARLGLAAVAERRWAVGSEALSLLRSKYPRSEFLDVTLLPAMEALIEIGAPAAASGPLQAFVTGLPNDPRATEAYLLLARARDATGDARGALAAYDGAEKSARGKTLGTETMLKHVRLLVQDRRWDVARPRLKNLIRSDEKTPEGRNAIAEASYYMGQDQSSQNDPLGAVEYLMTAGYLAPDSTYGQKALLAAGQEFARMRDPEAKAMAISVYDRLLGQPNLPLEVQQAARTARDALAAK